MDLIDHLKTIAERVLKHKEQISTEEATKNAFIMPFLQALGYDVFNPLEVVPEYVTDIGTKKGEKIDYAIFKDNQPTILIECKHWAQNLSIHDGQLLRYFHVSKARFGILTNGIIYRFYSDLVEPNIMDEKPFLEFNITDIRDNQIDELKKFNKELFNIESIITTASELKYTNEIKQLFQIEMTNPSNDFIKHFAKQVYPSKITDKILDQFTVLVKKSTQQYISDLITDRLKSALDKEVGNEKEISSTTNALQNKPDEKQEELSKIVTTEGELEGYFIVKSILRQKFDSNRIKYRDALSYFSILLDDNNRKTICRLYFNSAKKQIGIIDENKKEIKHELTKLDDIFNYSEQLLNAAQYFDKTKE